MYEDAINVICGNKCNKQSCRRKPIILKINLDLLTRLEEFCYLANLPLFFRNSFDKYFVFWNTKNRNMQQN